MRVTDPREVEYVVPDGTQLPNEICMVLELYIGTRVQNSSTGEKGTRYYIPMYLAQEWLAKFACADKYLLYGGLG